MKSENLSLVGVKLLTLVQHNDARGSFLEFFNEDMLISLGIKSFVQVNHSISKEGVFRGMHLQAEPHQQAKLVYCLSGSLIDFVLDVDHRSASFGEYLAVELDSSNPQALFIPGHYAHGFLTLSDNTSVLYGVDGPRNTPSETSIDVMSTGISAFLGGKQIERSEKDLGAESLEAYASSQKIR